MITLYGIKNCDTMKKARLWLDSQQIEYQFHDYKKEGIERKLLTGWIKKTGWQTLLNTRGTTYRKLPDDVKNAMDQATAIDAMLAQPSMIKRPVLCSGSTLLVGFKAAEYEQHLT